MADSDYSEDQFVMLGSEEDSDDDYIAEPTRQRTRPANCKSRKKQKRVPKLTYLARITESPEDGLVVANDDSGVDEKEKNILEKIRKMMQLAHHPGTGEAEAKAALRRATRLMQQQNITQADLIANENEAERSNRAGHSVVTITSTVGKMVKRQEWHGFACYAASEAFDVQYYSEKHDEGVDWVFYGLAENTIAAALAFEMLHNQIETWALERKRELKGRSAHSSYCAGVAVRVCADIEAENRMALRKAKEEDERRIQQEKEEAAAAIARLSGPIVPESDAKVAKEVEKQPSQLGVRMEDVPDKDNLHQNQESAQPPKAPKIDITSDVHPKKSAEQLDIKVKVEQLEIKVKPEPIDSKVGIKLEDHDVKPYIKHEGIEEQIRIKTEAEEDDPSFHLQLPSSSTDDVKEESLDDEASTTPHWTSALQLRTFKDNAKTIAENYLKKIGMKLHKGRKLKDIQYNWDAFNKGCDDGKKVDLKRRRIGD